VSQYRAGDFSTNYHTPPGGRAATDASVLGPPTSPSPILPLDLRANAQVEPMEEDPGSGVLQIVEKGEEEDEVDWEPEPQPMEESSSIFEEVMFGLQQKEVYESLVARLRDDRTFEKIAIEGLRAKILKMYAPIFKQQRQVRDRKTAELDRQKMLLIEREKEAADRRVEMQQKSASWLHEQRQMQRLKKDEEEADEAKWKWRMEKWRMEEDHTPQRNKRGFARPAALTPYGTVLRVSQ
jgi:hypothetical protein